MQQAKTKQVQGYEELAKTAQTTGGQKWWNSQRKDGMGGKVCTTGKWPERSGEQKVRSAPGKKPNLSEELVHMYEEQVKQNGDIQKDKLEQLQNNAALMTKNKELQTKNLQLEHKEQIQECNNLKENLQASVEEFDKLQQKRNKTQDENVTLAQEVEKLEEEKQRPRRATEEKEKMFLALQVQVRWG